MEVGGLYCPPQIPAQPRTEYWLRCQPFSSVLWGYIPEDCQTGPVLGLMQVVSHMTYKHVLGYIINIIYYQVHHVT